MSVDRVLTITLKYLQVIVWPAVVLTAVIVFRGPIKGLIERLDSVAGPANTSATFAVAAARNLAGVGEVEAEAQAVADAAADRAHGDADPHPGAEANKPPEQAAAPAHEADSGAKAGGANSEPVSEGYVVSPQPQEIAPGWFWEDVEGYEASLLRPLVSGWIRLENDARYIVNQLNLGKESVVLRRNPNDVLALFSYFEKQGLVSRDALETAIRTRRLRDELVHGRVDGRAESVADVAQAVEGLRRSLRKVGTALIGENVLRETGRADLIGRPDLPWR